LKTEEGRNPNTKGAVSSYLVQLYRAVQRIVMLGGRFGGEKESTRLRPKVLTVVKSSRNTKKREGHKQRRHAKAKDIILRNRTAPGKEKQGQKYGKCGRVVP